MRRGAIPFQLDIADMLERARRIASTRISGVTLNLPFVSIAVNPKDREKRIAREIVIRLKDRRVLSAWECCDDCISRALASLQEIRGFLVEQEVELADIHDGPLFLLVDAMTTGIRQFLTFEQSLSRPLESAQGRGAKGVERGSRNARQDYFDGLEILRGHLSRCLGQIAAIAGMKVPTNGLIENYQGDWQIEAYKRLILPCPEKVRNERQTTK